MDERVVDYLNDHVEELPFTSIFGDDLRIYVPIYKDPTAKEILDTLKRIKDYGGLDIEKGEVVRKIKLDPKYGQGDEKEQRMNIGSAISKLKISPEDKKKYLDWLARYKDNMTESLGEQKYGIIISRAPIDVLRMSDHHGGAFEDDDDIDSCHSPGASHFQCAVQEAINGGGVAYVVRNSEFAKALENGMELQDEEIFKDDDRGGGWLVPISRMRIRRFSNGEKEYGIPDLRIYGNKNIPGLYETIKEFLHSKQSISIDDFEDINMRGRGGSYYDNQKVELIRKFLDKDDEFTLEPLHSSEDRSSESRREYDIKSLTNNLEAECQDIADTYNNRMEYSKVYFNVEWDDSPYCIPDAYTTFDVSDWGYDFSDIDIYLDGRGDVEKAIVNGSEDDEVIWSGLLTWIEDNSGMELYSFRFYNNQIQIGYYSEGVFFHSDEFDTFCDTVDDYDRLLQREFQEPNDWIEIFQEIGVIPDQSNEDALNRMIENGSEDLTYDNERGDRNVEWTVTIDAITEETFDTYNVTSSQYGPHIIDKPWIGDAFATMLNNYVSQYFKIQPSNAYQPSLFESYYQTKLPGNNHITQYDITRVLIDIQPVPYSNSGGSNREIDFSLRLDVESFNDESVALILFLDNNLNDIKNMATFAYLANNRFIVTGSSRYKQQFNSLKRVYGNLL